MDDARAEAMRTDDDAPSRSGSARRRIPREGAPQSRYAFRPGDGPRDRPFTTGAFATDAGAGHPPFLV
jgi:hypothetical protein